MEKVVFFCVFSCWIMQITSSDLSVGGSSDLLRVQTGENIILNCSMIDRYEIAWFHLNSEQLNILISAKKDKTGRKLLIKYNQNRTRMNMTADTWVTRVSLTITGVTESDSGLYFCGITSKAPEMHFDKPIRLEIEDGETPTERVLMFAGVGLAAFVFFLATVVAGVIIYHRGWQKGLKAAKHGALMDQTSAE